MKPRLDDIKKEMNFQVPDRYFEDLPLKIQNRVGAENQPRWSWIQSRKAWQLSISAVAIILFSVLGTYILSSQTEESLTSQDLLSEVSQEQILLYLEEIELEEYEITSKFETTDYSYSLDGESMLQDVQLEGSEIDIDDVVETYNLESEYL